MMKSKNPKIQKILMKGIAITLTAMFTLTPLAYAATSLDDSYLEGSIIDKLLYGTVGSTVKEIEEHFNEEGQLLYIQNETGLRALAEYVNNGGDCEGQRIFLANDIVIDSQTEWVPIGTEENPFKGKFDGQGHTISGINFNRGDKLYSEITNIGLFGKVKSGTIKNVTISNSQFNIPYNLAEDITSNTMDTDFSGSATKYENLGGIVGYNEEGTIESCKIQDVQVNGIRNVGGIVGHNFRGTIKNCSVSSSKSGITGYIRVGGIVGRSEGDSSVKNQSTLDFSGNTVAKIIGCTNEGTVYGMYDDVGGIVGSQVKSSIVQKCENKGDISLATEAFDIYINGVKYTVSEPEDVGGIVGWSGGTDKMYSAIDGCINNGKVTGFSDVGGIAGQLGGSDGGYAILRNCINYNELVSASNPGVGFLVGEVVGENTAQAILYNNMYYLPKEEIEKATLVSIKWDMANNGEYEKYYKICGIDTTDVTQDDKIKSCMSKNGRHNISGTQKVQETGISPKEYNNYYKLGYGLLNKAQTTESYTKTIIENKIYELGTNEELISKSVSDSDSLNSEDFYPIYTGDQGQETKTSKIGTNTDVKVIKDSTLYTYNNNTKKIELNQVNSEIKDEDDGKDPIIDTNVYVENKLETGRYTAGKEVLIEVTTSEAIKDDFTSPEIQVSFSESGVGLYNWTGDTDTRGYAKCIESRIKGDGTTTWKYSYIIQEGDEGDLSIEYKGGEITDIAGNTTDILGMYEPYVYNSTVSDSGFPSEFYNSISVYYYTTSGVITTIKDGDFVPQDRNIYVEIGLNDKYYIGFEQLVDFRELPSLYINDVKCDYEAIGLYDSRMTITYEVEGSDIANRLTKVSNVMLKNEEAILYKYDAQAGKVDTDQKIETGSVLNIDIPDFYIDPLGVTEDIKVNDIYADTTAPTVEIIAKDVKNSATNKDIIAYEFKWSEEVIGFTAEDITVNNGTKGTLSNVIENEDGTYSYTMDITTNVENGNTGEIQVIIEKGACQDLVAQGNIRNSKTITIDRKSAKLESLEAYATSNISLDNSIDDVKEYYKVGDTVTIVATFDENIENTTTVPKLTLQFSESGNAKGTVSAGTISGNKITYTYPITNGDKGSLSVKGFSGTVIDSAGNETKVTKRTLDGDTIIADNTAPEIVSVTAIAPDFEYDSLLTDPGDTKRYGEGKQIKFLVEFSEDVYNLSDDKKINTISSDEDTAPVLTLRFGTGTTRNAVFSSVDGKVLEYTYDIQSGDNGNLSLVSIIGNISDIAGNDVTNPTLSTVTIYENDISDENKVDSIVADTTKPTVSLKVTQIENDGLTGTNNYYKAGNILTITATTNEYVYSKSGNNLSKLESESTPSLGIKFGAEAAKGTIRCTKVENTEGKTIFTYEYVIASGDYGDISLSFGENKYYDIALNSNTAGTKDNSSKAVKADTIAPNTSHLQGTNDNSYMVDNGDGTYTVKFTEKLYYLNNKAVTALTSSNVEANGPKLTLKNASGEFVEIAPSSINSDGTEITYNAESGQERIGISSYNKICDIAGNMYNSQVKIAPTLANIKITSPKDKTGKYSAGTEVTIVATFTKRIQGTVPTLKIKFGDEGTERTISSGTIDKDTITYKYTILEGDNGELSIVSLKGNGLRGEDGTLYEAPETISLTAGTITADTTKPTAQIKAYTDYKTSSKKEVTGKINAEVTTYEFTWSEAVKDFDMSDITVINGIKETFTKVSDTVYTLDVVNSNEGVQTVAITTGVCTDIAKEDGNLNEGARINSIEIDRSAPSVRFITPNGGNYTTTTDSRSEDSTGTATLKAKIEINENVSQFKYRVVKTGETAPEYISKSGNDINSSDIDITVSNAGVGEYVVEVIAIDEAGNEKTAKSNKYTVSEDKITFKPSTTEKTNGDITVDVEYQGSLTENRKAGIQGKTQSADSTKVIIGENGTVYAEATDIAGNKVYATLKITNIDKTEPDDSEEPNEPVTPPVEEDTEAPEIISANYSDRKINVVVTDNDVVEYITISDSKTQIPTTWTEISKDKDSNNYQSAQISVTSNGDYYVWAKDKSGNTSYYSTAVVVTGLDGDVEITVKDYSVIATPDQSEKYILVSPGTTVDNLKDKITIINGTKDKLTLDSDSLTSDGELRTTSIVKYDGSKVYTVVVLGDINCDGTVNFRDVISANAVRISSAENSLSKAQLLASDINISGSIEFKDIISINAIRLNSIK